MKSYFTVTLPLLAEEVDPVSCELLGNRPLVEAVERKLKIAPGETTDDGRFTLIELECLGSCGTAPVVQVNDDYHEEMTVEKMSQLLKTLE